MFFRCIVLSYFLLAQGYAGAGTVDVSIRLNKQQGQEGLTELVPFISGLPNGLYQYSVQLNKSGASGRTSSRQNGVFTVDGEDELALSRNKLNLDAADRCDLKVLIKSQGGFVVEKTFTCFEGKE